MARLERFSHGRLTRPLITCESVIAEAAWHPRESREAVDQLYSLVVAGALRIVELLPDHAPHLRALSAKYSQTDFCNAAVVRLSEMHPGAAVLTTDIAHFTVYPAFPKQAHPAPSSEANARAERLKRAEPRAPQNKCLVGEPDISGPADGDPRFASGG